MELPKIANAKRQTVLQDKCPITVITSMGDNAKKHIFIFDKTCVADIVLGRMPKVVKRDEDGDLIITWTGTVDRMHLKEISTTHAYVLYDMVMDGKPYTFNFADGNVIYLDR